MGEAKEVIIEKIDQLKGLKVIYNGKIREHEVIIKGYLQKIEIVDRKVDELDEAIEKL